MAETEIRYLMLTDKDKALLHKEVGPEFGYNVEVIANERELCPPFFGDGSNTAVPDNKSIIRCAGPSENRVPHWLRVELLYGNK